MNFKRLLVCAVWSLAGLAFSTESLGGTLNYRWRNPEALDYAINGLAPGSSENQPQIVTEDGKTLDVAPESYRIFSVLFGNSDGMNTVKELVGEKNVPDITLRVSESTNDPHSWSTGTTIQIYSQDDFRALGAILHEAAHSFMKAYYGGLPTDGMALEQKYGPDGEHYADEITTPETAFVEAFAEYVADSIAGVDASSKLIRYSQLRKETATSTKGNPDWNWKNFGDCTAEELWRSEAVNALILRDMAIYVSQGKTKLLDVIRTGGRADNLKEFIQKWVVAHPEDTATIIAIVDANTNYTMTDQELRDLFGFTPPYLDLLKSVTNILRTVFGWVPGMSDVVARLDNLIQFLKQGWETRLQALDAYLANRQNNISNFKGQDVNKIDQTLESLLGKSNAGPNVPSSTSGQSSGGTGQSSGSSGQASGTTGQPSSGQSAGTSGQSSTGGIVLPPNTPSPDQPTDPGSGGRVSTPKKYERNRQYIDKSK